MRFVKVQGYIDWPGGANYHVCFSVNFKWGGFERPRYVDFVL
ncbi:hypothetical protein M2103_001625 [Ereboglobus sp. PH5-5]|nr:hypothetical protein [Ereboglobus sp. PH5-5]MDF9833401.1 hypothetical protein [Ereboglobus sp. PH5-5]